MSDLKSRGARFTASKQAWSKRHDTWLRTQTWPLPALDQTPRAYLRAVDEVLARLRDVETELRALLDLEPLRAACTARDRRLYEPAERVRRFATGREPKWSPGDQLP